jgi:magnesium chelatase subunit I
MAAPATDVVQAEPPAREDTPAFQRIMERLGMDGGESFGEAAAALEFALEGLYLMRRLSKDVIDGSAVYRT